MPEDLPLPERMKSPSLSRRIYNSSFTLAISFGFYAFICLFTLSCEGEETGTLPAQAPTEDVTQQDLPADAAPATATEVISYVENVSK